jgi:hypothetical protein
VVVFIVKIDNLDFGLIDPECDAPVLGDKQAPCAFTITGELMRFPTWNRAQLILSFHILEERNDAKELGNHGRLQAGRVIVLNQTAQTFVDHVSDSHEINLASKSTSVKLHYTPYPHHMLNDQAIVFAKFALLWSILARKNHG